MDWNKLKDKIYYWDGSWRDIYVKSINRSDWEKWVDLVNANYKVNWFNGRQNRDENLIDFSVIDDYWNGNHDLCSTAKIFIDKIQINAHFFDDTEIENDIDPGEFNTINDHEKLIHYMTELSTLLEKEVILTPENEQNIVLIKVYKDKVELRS